MNIKIYIYVKELAEKDNRIKIISSGLNIKEMLEEVGYPFKSKEHSKKVKEYRAGARYKKILEYFGFIPGGYRPCPQKLLYQIKDESLKISSKCCDKLKKEPANKWSKENNKTVVITGMLKEEGGVRNNVSCITIDSKTGKLKRFHPLSIITKSWEDWYANLRNIRFCKLYYPPYNFERTGCKGCPFNTKLDKDLFFMRTLLPAEARQCEIIWEPVYKEYRKIGFRLSPKNEFDL